MKAHIADIPPTPPTAEEDKKALESIINFLSRIEGKDESELMGMADEILNSGITSEGFLALLGNNIAEVIANRELQPVGIQLLSDTATIPQYANEGDACADVCADEDVEIKPGETVAVRTGFALVIPNGFVCHVYPRSGLSLKTGLRLANSVGIIDAGYRDEVKVPCWNSGTDPIHIVKGMRIAQICIKPAPMIDFVEIEDVKEFGNDRGGGFGHSGLFAETVDENG